MEERTGAPLDRVVSKDAVKSGNVRVHAQPPASSSVEERKVFLLGTKGSLSTANLYSTCKAAFGELTEAEVKKAIAAVEPGDNGDSFPIRGKDAAAICPPEKASRYNCPARPDAVKSLLKDYLSKKKNATVLVVAPKDHLLPLVAGVARACPPLWTGKNVDTTDYEISIVCVEIGVRGQLSFLTQAEAFKLDATAEGIRMCAKLVDLPANLMHTDAMVEEARMVARLPNVKLDVIQGEALRDQGFGGLWGIGMAGPRPPALAVLSYDPPGAPRNAQAVCWVGKGIVYDTGGLSMKTAATMPTMKRDMGGSAAIISAFYAAAKIGPNFKLRAVLCLAENSVDSIAMRPDDVIKMRSGKTVEVNNTDAEGRLVLGDGVHYAGTELNPSLILDMATLTGHQYMATGKKHAGIMTNDAQKEVELRAAGKTSGDLVFPVVYCPEILQPMCHKSDVADMKNVADDRMNALCSAAGHFIEEHLPKEYKGPWVHVDMASTVAEGDRGTGYGVALLLRFSGVV